MFVPDFWVQSWKRLLQDHGRGDGKGRALARRHMAPTAGTAYFPGLYSQIGSALFIIRYRNARLRVYLDGICSYCHACRRSRYSRTGTCISRRRTHALLNPPASIPDRVIRELGHEEDVRMPGRTRGETRAMRDSQYSMVLMFHAALAQNLATREAFDETFR